MEDIRNAVFAAYIDPKTNDPSAVSAELVNRFGDVPVSVLSEYLQVSLPVLRWVLSR